MTGYMPMQNERTLVHPEQPAVLIWTLFRLVVDHGADTNATDIGNQPLHRYGPRGAGTMAVASWGHVCWSDGLVSIRDLSNREAGTGMALGQE